jgi:hypothetical protein
VLEALAEGSNGGETPGRVPLTINSNQGHRRSSGKTGRLVPGMGQPDLQHTERGEDAARR